MALIGIIEYIQTTQKQIREKLKDQTKGSRSPSRTRYEEPTVEDRASTKFKERAATGHTVPADTVEFDDAAAGVLVKDLINNKNYPDTTAREIAEVAKQRNRKVIFVEMASEMEAFFSVEQQPGITQIAFNRSHPAYERLSKTLDGATTDSTDKDLIERIHIASETMKMLFAAWARQEIEDMPNREKLKRMRNDWGRMANDFLNDDQE